MQDESSASVQPCNAGNNAQTLDRHVSTVHKILQNILHCYPYKISHMQELLLADPTKRDFYINNQIWATKNLLAYQPVLLHPAKVTVGCGLMASFIIGSYFFKEMCALGHFTITSQSFAQPCHFSSSTVWMSESDHFHAR